MKALVGFTAIALALSGPVALAQTASSKCPEGQTCKDNNTNTSGGSNSTNEGNVGSGTGGSGTGGGGSGGSGTGGGGSGGGSGGGGG